MHPTRPDLERLQAQLTAVHSRIPAEEAAKLLELRRTLPPGPAIREVQPPLPGLEPWL